MKHIISASRFHWLASVLIFSVAASSSIYWWGLSLSHRQLRIEAIDKAGKRAAQLAELQARHMEALFLGIDQSLKQFRGALQANNKSSAAAIARTSLNSFPPGALTGFLATDANGDVTFFYVNTSERSNVTYYNSDSSERYYVGDREYFRFHLSSSKDQLFISKPVHGRTSEKWAVPFTRPLLEREHFAGLVIASFSADYLSSMLAKVAMGSGDVASLLYSDGTFVARSQNLQDVLGKSALQDRPFLNAGAADHGVFHAAGAADNVPRIFAWHKLEGYPLFIAVGLEERAILASIEQQIRLDKKRSALSIAFIAALVIVISILLVRAARQQKLLESSEATLRSILDSTEDGIIVVGKDGAVVDANRRFYELWRVPEEIAARKQGKRLLAHMLDQLSEPEWFKNSVMKIVQTDMERLGSLQFKDGRIFERYTRSFYKDKQRVRLWAFRDITVQRKAEERLQLAASVFTHAQEGIVITDQLGIIIEVNDMFTQITGYSREEALGQNPRILKSCLYGPEFYEGMWGALIEKGSWSGEIWNRHKSGELYAELLTISAVRDETGKLLHYVALFTDITQIKKHEKQLENMAYYDVLTGLPNRVLLADRLHQAIIQSHRRNSWLAVAYLDLDGFKAVNDDHGHDVGDKLLVALSERMKAVIREVDTLARIGGDEFVIVINDLEQPQDYEPVVMRLLQAAAEPVAVKDAVLQVSASIGVTLYQRDGIEADQLLRRADQAMYFAKQGGKSRYHLLGMDQSEAVQTNTC